MKEFTMFVQRSNNHDYAPAPTWNDAVSLVGSMPSAEPERKKGKWSNYKDEHCCSVCKCVVISDCWDDEIRYDYCPYCGAEME